MVEARPSSVSSMVKGTAFVFVSRAADAIVGFLFSIVAARIMGKDLYGLVGATLGIVGIVSLLAHMGIPNATVKYVSEYVGTKRMGKVKAVVKNTFLLEMLLGGLAAVLCFGLAEPLATNVFGRPELATFLRLAAPLSLLMPFTAGLNAVFQGYQRQEFFAATTSAAGTVRLISATIFLLRSPTVESAIMGYLLGAMVGSVMVSVIVVARIYPAIKKRSAPIGPELRRMVDFGLPVMLTAASIMIYNWVGTLFLTAFSTVEEVSWFNIAYGMVNIPVMITMSISTAYYPIVSDLHARKRHRMLRATFSRVVKLASVIMVPVVFILLAVGEPLILLLYGMEFLPAFLPLTVLAMWGLIRPIAAISNSVSNGIGKPFLNTKANIITLVLAIILNTLLVPKGRPYPLDLIPVEGMMGAALAITISFAIGMSIQIHYASRATRTGLPLRAWGKCIAAAGMTAVLILLMVERIMPTLREGEGPLLPLAVTLGLGLMGLGLYLLMVKVTHVLNEKDVELVQNMPLPMKGPLVRLMKALAK
jgi:stage V sporulation protein B